MNFIFYKNNKKLTISAYQRSWTVFKHPLIVNIDHKCVFPIHEWTWMAMNEF